ncbi:hypothetical protein AZ34_02355 [Hylemonella gracilis str. Niagara R]|uniref:DUF2971 domain-containing protein n=1 Tax=Hylemonella gracilis str. Niagara R TaxID=1458275 RepID=A0A016XFT9_9BURK|nr:DUF2971 domain-containing protein [Hylemonella gracilis]EYC50033.1 hypothetical protein AZ34_02355 [Hylemonella gracilis str. Niagara R]
METSSTENLYRILPFDRAVEVLKGSLYFSHPSMWDDPYETIVDHDKAHAMFAQCWCMNGVSDAMWRIYSPNSLGVRIRTTRSKLEAAMKKGMKRGYKKRIKEVEYETTMEVKKKAEKIAKELSQVFDPKKAADLFFMKRSAFKHEQEVRALLFCEDAPANQPQKGWTINVDGCELVESILLDPRVPEHFGAAMKNYLKREIRFNGSVQKSALYSKPPVFDGRVPAEDL